MKKYTLLFSACLLQAGIMFSQSQAYDNFEGSKSLHYGARSGALDTAAANPYLDNVNKSGKCAKYVRNIEKKFDNIKMNFNGKMTDVTKYATYTGIPPKLTMKVYTNAPVGTLVEIQLGKAGVNEYPAGTHSQYQAYTTVSNAWEQLEFKFSQVPKGSETAASDVDRLTLLFNPNSITADTYYFSEITGPSITASTTEKEKITTNEKTAPAQPANTAVKNKPTPKKVN